MSLRSSVLANTPYLILRLYRDFCSFMKSSDITTKTPSLRMDCVKKKTLFFCLSVYVS